MGTKTTTTTEEARPAPASKWWASLINLQSLVAIGAAFVSIVTFWNTQKNHSGHLDQIDKLITILTESKASTEEVKALSERVTRQYESSNKILDRIIELEKQQQYEKGKHDAQHELLGQNH